MSEKVHFSSAVLIPLKRAQLMQRAQAERHLSLTIAHCLPERPFRRKVHTSSPRCLINVFEHRGCLHVFKKLKTSMIRYFSENRSTVLSCSKWNPSSWRWVLFRLSPEWHSLWRNPGLLSPKWYQWEANGSPYHHEQRTLRKGPHLPASRAASAPVS